MTMSKYNKQLPRVKRFLEEIDWMFALNNYERNIRVMDHDHDEYDIAAEIHYDEKYQRITVKFYPTFFRMSLIEQRKCLLHELCHAITMPSKTAAHDLINGTAVTKNRINDINEEATSRIENLLNGLLTGRYKYARLAYHKYVQTRPKRKVRAKRR